LSRPTIIAALIAVATVLFAVGTTIERNQRKTETIAQHAAEGGGGETAAHRAAEGPGEAPSAVSNPSTTASSERILGIDPESPGLVIVAVIASLLLAVAVLRRPGDARLLLAVGLLMVAFAALDVREVVHQGNESRTGLAVLAGVVTALHLAAAAGCVTFRPDHAPATTPG
jgi:hypothetical protein